MRLRIVLTAALLLAICTMACAAPEFVYLSKQQVGNEWQFNYKLSNIGGSVSLYDVEIDAQYSYGWLQIYCPGGWVVVEPITGPMARFQTTDAPCDVDTEKYGFHIMAASPYLYYGGTTVTDENHAVVASGQTWLPVVPEPGSLMILGSGMVGLAGMLIRRRR